MRTPALSRRTFKEQQTTFIIRIYFHSIQKVHETKRLHSNRKQMKKNDINFNLKNIFFYEFGEWSCHFCHYLSSHYLWVITFVKIVSALHVLMGHLLLLVFFYVKQWYWHIIVNKFSLYCTWKFWCSWNSYLFKHKPLRAKHAWYRKPRTPFYRGSYSFNWRL